MITVTVTITQGQAQQSAPPAPPSPQARAEMAENIRRTIQQAQAAAEEAANNASIRAAQAQARAEGSNRRVTVGPNGIIVEPNTPGQPMVVVDPRAAANMIPQQAVDMVVAFCIMIAVIVVGWPIARAFGRRIERRGQVATLDSGTLEQLQRIEQAVDAMSIEVERISESQRFMARLQRDASSQALPGMQSP